jgi:hypothetical protein
MPGLCRYGLDCIMHGTESQYCTTIKCMLKKHIPVREFCSNYANLRANAAASPS